MNVQISELNQFRKSAGHCRLFSDITKKKKMIESKQQKMICTKDTESNEVLNESLSFRDFEYHLQNQIANFKSQKAEQIADIAVDGDIPVKNIVKRIRNKLQSQLFEHLKKIIGEMQLYEERSAEKNTRSPKQLGSTIEHTFTPQSIETPAFEFSSGSKRINEFSVGSNQFTLGNQQRLDTQTTNENIPSERQRTVSEFNVGSRNPTSKRIKDKIMNSKRNQVY